MNANTRTALIEFSIQVARLAEGVVLTIGQKQTEEILAACVDLHEALAMDETVLDLSHGDREIPP